MKVGKRERSTSFPRTRHRDLILNFYKWQKPGRNKKKVTTSEFFSFRFLFPSMLLLLNYVKIDVLVLVRVTTHSEYFSERSKLALNDIIWITTVAQLGTSNTTVHETANAKFGVVDDDCWTWTWPLHGRKMVYLSPRLFSWASPFSRISARN